MLRIFLKGVIKTTGETGQCSRTPGRYLNPDGCPWHEMHVCLQFILRLKSFVSETDDMTCQCLCDLYYH
jgi:hypothetical protein